MKILRRIVRNGNSTQVSIPPRMMEFLRWRQGDPIVLEITDRLTVEVRPPNITDIRSPALPMLLDGSLPDIPK